MGYKGTFVEVFYSAWKLWSTQWHFSNIFFPRKV